MSLGFLTQSVAAHSFSSGSAKFTTPVCEASHHINISVVYILKDWPGILTTRYVLNILWSLPKDSKKYMAFSCRILTYDHHLYCNKYITEVKGILSVICALRTATNSLAIVDGKELKCMHPFYNQAWESIWKLLWILDRSEMSTINEIYKAGSWSFSC